MEGNGFILRELREEDAETIVKYLNNKKIAGKLLTVPYPYKVEYYYEWLHAEKPYPVFAIEVEGEAVGSIGIHEPLPYDPGEVRLGYWLAEKHWNKGIMTQAIKLVTKYAFKELKVKSVSACTFLGNESSARVLEKAGFEYQGIKKEAYEKEGKKLDAKIFFIAN